MVTMIIAKDNNTSITDYPSQLWRYGFDEWEEIRNAIQKYKSKYKEYVEDHLNKLFDKVSKIVKIPPLPLKPSRIRKTSEAEDNQFSFSRSELRFLIDSFNIDADCDISMLNISLPEKGPYALVTILLTPELGLMFISCKGKYCFQRMSELHLYPIPCAPF